MLRRYPRNVFSACIKGSVKMGRYHLSSSLLGFRWRLASMCSDVIGHVIKQKLFQGGGRAQGGGNSVRPVFERVARHPSIEQMVGNRADAEVDSAGDFVPQPDATAMVLYFS